MEEVEGGAPFPGRGYARYVNGVSASEEDNATREDNNDSDQHSVHNIYARTAPEILRTEPNDPTAVLDTGAMMTTIPRRLILGTKWEASIRAATSVVRLGRLFGRSGCLR
jgi:hypothetical protein